MGDRNNPIKFGPEWLRNLSRERSASASANNNQNTATASGTAAAGTASGSSGGTANAAGVASNTNTNTIPPKVQLAKLRYGREEMLALYERTSDAPQELKYIDILYQPRGKPPVALNNSFEEDMRDTMRTGPPIAGAASGERFGIGRGMGRGVNLTEVRGRPRLPFIRQLSAGRGTSSWHLGSPRMPGYSGGADDDASSSLRSWSNSNGGSAAGRSSGDQAEWTTNKTYRSKRPGANTNWRSQRDEEEWRGAENNRVRPPQDKWERDWGDNRASHRPRTWVGGDTQNNEDNLPEWAVDNAEACGGTFDSSGAFHGYSNDDSNLPKSQEAPYALTRSHTHGSFVRSKPAEEGSEEWWASEKAKKLSPKRFDASDIKFKKTNAVMPEISSGTSTGSKSNANKEEAPGSKVLEKSDSAAATVDCLESNSNNADDSFNKKSVRFVESKTFDALMRSDINMEEVTDERGNFQSVMINPNNSLRQKHQNIVSSASNSNNRQSRKPGILQMLHNSQSMQPADSEISNQHSSNPENKIVEDMIELTLGDNASISKLTASSEPLMSNSSAIAMSSAMSSGMPSAMSSVMSSAMSTMVNSVSQMNSPAMQLRMSSPIHPIQGLAMNPNSGLASQGIHSAGLQPQGIQTIGITNSALNASLGLPLGPNNPMGQTMGLPLQGVPPPMLPHQGMGTAAGGLQPGQLSSYQPGGGLPGMSASNVVNNSLFLGQNTSNASLQPTNDLQINHGNQNMYPMHGLQHSGSQAAFNSSIYSNIMQQSAQSPNSQSLAIQWYYEDPKKNIQGPFSAKEMYSWYRAGFFSPSLMVRRACDAVMRPLGSYGPIVPFVQMDHMMSPFPMGSGFEPRNQGPHDSLLNSQQGLGMDVMNMSETSSMDAMQFGTVGIIRTPPFGQQQMVDSLWSQPTPNPDLLWMQQAINARNEARVNNLPMFFWDQQPSAIASNSLLPESITKEMKTEDEILAQLRASQNVNAPPKLPFGFEQPPLLTGPPPVKPDDTFLSNVNMAPNMEELQKLIQEDSLKNIPPPPLPHKGEKNNDMAQINALKGSDRVTSEVLKQQPVQTKRSFSPDPKTSKQTKNEMEKPKNKDLNNAKTKSNKKGKEEKKEDYPEMKSRDEELNKSEKRSEEASPTKSKKEDKANKKDAEKEKNQWIKEGFTIVKTEKNAKDGKKKTEEVKAMEDAERKRKEEERLADEEEKRRRQADLLRRQQEQQQQQQQRQAAESVSKKAPWSAVGGQALQPPNKDGLTLAEIQRLEREKKLEQMKEQQQMMQIIAQQQAAALAREQEMQAGLGWAIKKPNLPTLGQNLAEIQAEARKAAAAAAMAASQALEEVHPAPAPPVNHAPWGNSHNGGSGFWDTQPIPVLKVQEVPKPVEVTKTKKKPTLNMPVKKEVTPAAEFELWCTTVLASWSAKIDVPTFVGFLRDIESPYEIKDYVKCYLGDTKDSNDFARQFLERRSKLLRVGMVTPSDDLCSPAIAVNPRTISGSDYQEVKSKGKKTKKNKMMKVDAARLLGFSVTASEDRINVGDIDTA